MAFMRDRQCTVCDEMYTEVESARRISKGICHKCEDVENLRNKNKHFIKLDKMTTEQRLRRLEKVQYNNSLVKNEIPYNPNTIYG